MTMAARRKERPLIGHEKPRLAPPMPARSKVGEYVKVAEELGLDLFPFQKLAGRYMNAIGPDDRWLYPECAVVVARQNGKTRMLVPLIISRLRAGQRITHAAQHRELVRELFGEIADEVAKDESALKMRGGRLVKPRFGSGQEEIRMGNGGVYRIVASNREGARGQANDLVIVDELREMTDFGFISAIKPTLTASRNPQMIYLSNAGAEHSVVLNAVRLRSETDPSLAYLEWSASPERAADDIEGWLESNPAIGHMAPLLEYLRHEYETNKQQGTLSIFETEHLCRAVVTMRSHLVDELQWSRCHEPDLEAPVRPALALSMSPDGSRASVAAAWPREDSIGLQLLFDVTGSPINTARLGKEARDLGRRLGVRQVGFDPLTDAELARYFPKPTPISGQKFANATAQFANLVSSDHVRWNDAGPVSEDLNWTARKQDRETGTYQAVRASDDRPITASLAAIRAVWLASGPKPELPTIG